MSDLPASGSLLVITTSAGAPILTDYSSRGLKQTLEPIPAAKGQLHRTVNGTLINLSPPQMRKYASSITGDDMAAPAFDAFWPGQEVIVNCVAELSYPTAGGAPARPVVSSRTEGAFTFYTPQLTMLVMEFQAHVDEWGARVGWNLSLEEL